MGKVLRSSWLAGLLVALATFVVFIPALGNGFVNWDDDENFLWNPHYRGLAWANLRWMFTAVHQGLYTPTAWLTLGLDYVLWGMAPAGYHLTSVVLHAANALLCYLVARRLLAAAFAPGGATGDSALTAGALTAALFFALHPLRVESVAWVTERRDVVVGLFTLLVVLAYLRAWERGTAGRLHRGWYWVSVALFVPALLAKAIVVGLPLVLFALDVHPLRRLGTPGSSATSVARAMAEKIPFVILSAGVSALSIGILAGQRAISSLDALGPVQRLALSAYGLAFYLAKTLAPWPLAPLYPMAYPVEPWTAKYLFPAALVTLITVATILAARRWTAGLIVWVSYALLLAPVLGLFQAGPQIAADRYSYLAGLGLALLAGAAVVWAARASARGRISPLLGRAVPLAAALVLVLLAVQTIRQVGVWRDSVTLWRHAIAAEPDSDIPIFYLGWALADEGRFDEARALFTDALGRVPPERVASRAELLLHRGILDQRRGNLSGAERDFREVLSLDAGHPAGRIRLGSVRAAQGDQDEAIALFTRAATLLPEWRRYPLWEIRAAITDMPPTAPGARAALEVALGISLQQFNALDQAEVAYRRALELAPGHVSAWNNLGVVQAQQGRLADAADSFARALQLEPGNRDACANGRRAAAAARRTLPELDRCPAPRP